MPLQQYVLISVATACSLPVFSSPCVEILIFLQKKKSSRLEEEFMDGEDIVLFDLSKLEFLPGKIMHLFSNEKYLEHLAQNGHRKATENHL